MANNNTHDETNMAVHGSIIELTDKYADQVKTLLVDLQKYIIEIDKYKLNIISEDYREKYFNKMINECKYNQGKVFVYVLNEAVIGVVAGFIEKYDSYDKLVYSCPKKGIISEMIIDKRFRKYGIGTSLISAMENYFFDVGCQYIQLDVFAYNSSARSFYVKNGYEERMITMFKKL